MTADFSVSQGVNVQNFTIQDTSSSPDPNVTTRTISLYLVDGSLLGGAPIEWPASDGNTKAINGLLTRDLSLNIVVSWTSSSPIPGSTYSKTRVVTFLGNSNSFAYGLLQQIAAQQNIQNDPLFTETLATINSDILNAERATDYDDQGNAQAALDRIYYFIVNQNRYF
jgi:hypothetical protein